MDSLHLNLVTINIVFLFLFIFSHGMDPSHLNLSKICQLPIKQSKEFSCRFYNSKVTHILKFLIHLEFSY
ncbi:hypothetical protein CIPAW_02G160000 [Carya illinoinensis]|uniref:Uncharacterized protein n=1 Tax=Carya illinoinensis TaxID=32201 RepID=A0A8T1RFP4_CARIL|nr:hypothetical protein CIPAW_02G160000 [Carya illinoinensis]